jgi:hypothetical protein
MRNVLEIAAGILAIMIGWRMGQAVGGNLRFLQ